jgi:acyl carrier protein
MKVDRRALQEREVSLLLTPTSAFRIPESTTEKGFAVLWNSLLKVEKIGLDNNFFELGGDSLLALNFIGLVQQQYGATLEGMEVLRESLEVLARICDHRAGRPAVTRESPPQIAATETRELFYFGPEKSLFGVLTTPTIVRRNQAVLICCASGHEDIRSTFIIQNLTKQIVQFGSPVFRFDYFGCRDALGENKDATCSRWQQDIDTAQQELRYRTGIENIVAIGIRFGATLLLNSSLIRGFSRLVLWDPIVQGASYYRELQNLHQEYLYAQPHLRLKSRIFRTSSYHELLGMHYSQKMMQEINAIHIKPEYCPGMLTHCLLTNKFIPEERMRLTLPHHPLNQITSLSIDCSWQNPAALEEILPDSGISKALANLIKGAS